MQRNIKGQDVSQLRQQRSFRTMVTPFALQNINWFYTKFNLIWCLNMLSNLSTVCLWAGYGVSQGIFQVWVNARQRSEVRSSPGEQQPITGSDFQQQTNHWQPKIYLGCQITQVGLFLTQHFFRVYLPLSMCSIHRQTYREPYICEYHKNIKHRN